MIPYDGNEIGTFFSDAIRNIAGSLSSNGYIFIANQVGLFSTNPPGIWSFAGNQTTPYGTVSAKFDASHVVPTAHENRPVSTSALFCISY